MRIVLTAIAILPAEKGAPDTTGGAMIVRRVIEADLLATRNGHVDSIHGSAMTITSNLD